MKTRIFASILFLSMALIQPAAAELLIGVKGSVQDVEFDTLDSEDPTAAASILVGFEVLDLPAFDLAVEGEFTTSLTEGEVINDDFSHQSLGIFASIRIGGSVYFVGRVGVIAAEYDFDDQANLDGTGSAVSLGVGFSTVVKWEVLLESYDYEDFGTVNAINFGFNF